MDWAKARAFLLAAFTVVNLILAYSVWGPTALFPYMNETQGPAMEELRETLFNRRLVLPATVPLPRTPGPMRFLRVETSPTPDLMKWAVEISDAMASSGVRDDIAAIANLRPTINPQTQALQFFPQALGLAAHDVKLDSREHVVRVAEDYLRTVALFPPGGHLSAVTENKEKETVTVEYVPVFDGHPVYSGYVRAELSVHGVEAVTRLWVVPREYSAAPAKQVRPAREALLRLAGRLASAQLRTVTDIQLGYYAGRTLPLTKSDDVHGWDTVPVWRITLDGGEMYFINAFNGEWESQGE